MAKQSVGNTALGAAMCRLIEQSQPEETRLFNDPVVKDLVGTPIRMLMQFESLRNFTIKQTEAIMQGIYGTQICRTRFIDDAVESALSQGIAQVVIFVWEGVTQYLLEEAVRRTLAFVGKSAPGSILVFTYVLKSIIERRSDIAGADKMMDVVAKNNAPWLFGLEPSRIPSYLSPFHLHVIADVGNAEYQARYLKPLGRKLVVSEGERIVQARVLRL